MSANNNRAEKSGFAAEAQQKIHGKFDPEQAGQILRWINAVSGQSVNTDGNLSNFLGVLKDGTVLCKLANALAPGSVRKVNESKMAFKQMENIQFFLNFVEGAAGIPKAESFMTTDLYEGQDPNSVLVCLSSIARKGEKFGKAALGPKESHRESREWSEEQLRAGEGVIGLQAGTNKGANASGVVFGGQRHILLNK